MCGLPLDGRPTHANALSEVVQAVMSLICLETPTTNLMGDENKQESKLNDGNKMISKTLCTHIETVFILSIERATR